MRFFLKNRKTGDEQLCRKGFTLIELLVVMAIIALLSTLAVGGYLTYRKSALLNLTADNLVSQINALRSKTIYGSGNVEKFDEIKSALAKPVAVGNAGGQPKTKKVDVAKCEGIYFHSTTPGVLVAASFEQDFSNQKKWVQTATDGKWVYDACGSFDQTLPLRPFDLDQQVTILSITDEQGMALAPFVMRFVPTNGALEISKDGGKNFISDFTKDGVPKVLKITIQYGPTDVNYQKVISFDLH